jgi:sec-independent protein translocase protein TatA
MFSSVLLFMDIGMQELVLIMLVALLLFGGDKLPELARGLGKGIRDFKDASESVKREINNQIDNIENHKPAEKTNAIAQNSEPVQTDDQDPYNYSDGNFDDVHQHTQVANTIRAGQGHAVASDQLDATADEPVDYHAFKSDENQNEGSDVSAEANKESEPYKS